MAQILLHWTFWAIFTLASSCVVPLAPEFQDPPKVPNYPPYFVDSFPFFGVQITAPETFEVTVADPNPQDTLYVRWVSDYPGFTQASVLLRTEESIRPGVVKYGTAGPPEPDGSEGPACAKFSSGTEHRLVVIVSDSEFLPPELADNRDYRFNAVPPTSRTRPIMAGWNITCP